MNILLTASIQRLMKVPGPYILKGGNSTAGFFGEALADEFIRGDELAELVGLSAGDAIYSDAPWLKFALDGKILFVAKRPYRCGLNWSAFDNLNITRGDREIIIRGHRYKIRLMRGADTDNPLLSINVQYDPVGTWNSEWNRLMYHVSARPFSNPLNKLTSAGIHEGDWAQYSEDDLAMTGPDNLGAYTLCMETASNGGRVARGYHGVSYSVLGTPEVPSSPTRGWRPVLELVE